MGLTWVGLSHVEYVLEQILPLSHSMTTRCSLSDSWMDNDILNNIISNPRYFLG